MTIQEIEGRTEREVIEILKKNQLGGNKSLSTRLREYSIAKKICFDGKFIDSGIYDKQIGWICKYLKV